MNIVYKCAATPKFLVVLRHWAQQWFLDVDEERSDPPARSIATFRPCFFLFEMLVDEAWLQKLFTPGSLMELSCWCRSTSARQCNFCSLTMHLWWMAGDQRDYAGAFGQPGYTPRWSNCVGVWMLWTMDGRGFSRCLWSCIYRAGRDRLGERRAAGAPGPRTCARNQGRAWVCLVQRLGQKSFCLFFSPKVPHTRGWFVDQSDD